MLLAHAFGADHQASISKELVFQAKSVIDLPSLGWCFIDTIIFIPYKKLNLLHITHQT